MCTPTTVAVKQLTDCTATVTDTSSGTPGTPTGQVRFSSDGPGTFAHLTCTLAAVSAASAQCAESYRQKVTGTPAITAAYHGDAGHAVSSGGTGLAVG